MYIQMLKSITEYVLNKRVGWEDEDGCVYCGVADELTDKLLEAMAGDGYISVVQCNDVNNTESARESEELVVDIGVVNSENLQMMKFHVVMNNNGIEWG